MAHQHLGGHPCQAGSFLLCLPRVSTDAAPLLGEWLTKSVEQRKSELKPGSIQRLSEPCGRLKHYFGPAVRIDELTPNNAADWRAEMVTSGISEATTRLHCRNAKSIFAGAVDRELIGRNPFAKLKNSSIAANRDRYVTPDETTKFLGECHSVQWKLVFGLARFAGLHVPSESHRQTWEDVDWGRKRLTVYAPTTEATRIVPTLFTILQDAFDAALVGMTKIVSLAARSSNVHQGLGKIITRAGLVPWDDQLQTLRRSAETDFAKRHPQHGASK